MLPLANPEVEIAMAEEVMRKNLSVREVEERVRRIRNEDIPDGTIRKEPNQQAKTEEMYYRDVELRLSQDLGRKVTITPGRKRGKLSLEYYDIDDLNTLLFTLTSAVKPRKGGKQP